MLTGTLDSDPAAELSSPKAPCLDNHGRVDVNTNKSELTDSCEESIKASPILVCCRSPSDIIQL
jgi:hypothetical protein